MFNKFSRNVLLTPFLIWAGLFIFIPLIFIIWYGVTDNGGNFSLTNLGRIFEHGFLDALVLSVELALASTIICLVLAYPLCLILTERQRDNTTIISLLFILPLWMNSLLSTMAWQTILEGNGIINQILRLVNLPSLQMINTPGAIILGMVYNFLPYMVLPLFISLSKIDRSILEAAQDLGANSWQKFAVDVAGSRQRNHDGFHSRVDDVRYQRAFGRRKTFADWQHNRTGIYISI